MFRIKIACIFCFAGLTLNAQKIEDIRQSVAQNKVAISYNLEGTNPEEAFYIEIFLNTEDDKRTRLKLLEGDAGYNVTPGRKNVLWDYNNELIFFEGDVSFEIIGRPLFYFNEDKDVVRRSKTVNVNILRSGDYPISKIHLIDKEGNKEEIMSDINTETVVQWSIPGVQSVGTYRLQAETTDGTLINGGNFKIQRRIPNFVKALPAIIAGGYIFYRRVLAPLPEPTMPGEIIGN